MKLTPTFNFGRPYRSIWSVLLGFFLIFTLFSGIPSKSALATNPYVSNVVFDYESATGYYFVTFYVDTTFTLSASDGPDYDASVYLKGLDPNNSFNTPGWIWQYDKTSANNPLTYTAGNTYKSYIYNTFQLSQMGNPAYIYLYSNHQINGESYIDKLGNTQTYGWGSPVNPTWIENDDIYYIETPTLTITYPENNAEIAESFYTTGSFTQPASQYQYLTMFMSAVGGGSYIDVFSQTISGASSGTMSIWVNGVPAGYYDFDIYMRDNESNFYPQGGWPITNIHIVNDLPFTLPPYGGQPPTTAPPVFDILAPAPWYASNSPYETSTALFDTLTNTFAPVILAIGDSLTNLAQNFTQSNASSTGNQLGQSIILVRSYLTNINAFFSNFPVGQFLLLYLIALVVVIVLRLVKGLIGLFKI